MESRKVLQNLNIAGQVKKVQVLRKLISRQLSPEFKVSEKTAFYRAERKTNLVLV